MRVLLEVSANFPDNPRISYILTTIVNELILINIRFYHTWKILQVTNIAMKSLGKL